MGQEIQLKEFFFSKKSETNLIQQDGHRAEIVKLLKIEKEMNNTMLAAVSQLVATIGHYVEKSNKTSAVQF